MHGPQKGERPVGAGRVADQTSFARSTGIIRQACPHAKRVLLRLECGGGGVQYRRYCMTCWCAGPAIPHARVHDELRGEIPPTADPDLIEAARAAYWRRQREGLA